MKIVNITPNIENILSAFAGLDWHRSLFFDLETTGLNHKRSHLYLIGALWLSQDGYTLRQWFAEKPGDEREIFQNFLQFSSGFARLVHYNGTSFDLPYLIRKCAFYGLDPSPFQKESCDLYARFRPLKPWIPGDNLKLKTVEKAVGLLRKDCYSGKELIELYKSWLQTNDPKILECLLLHNHEDVTGMVYIQRLFSLLALREGVLTLSPESRWDGPDTLLLGFHPAEALPFPLDIEQNGIRLTTEAKRLVLKLSKRHGELRLYFPDYRNYYYLPQEDRAIHKSVAVYTDPAYRKKATPDTCYERHTGTFLPQWGDSFTPAFREHRGDKQSYFLCSDQIQEENKLAAYGSQIIQSLLK